MATERKGPKLTILELVWTRFSNRRIVPDASQPARTMEEVVAALPAARCRAYALGGKAVVWRSELRQTQCLLEILKGATTSPSLSSSSHSSRFAEPLDRAKDPPSLC